MAVILMVELMASTVPTALPLADMALPLDMTKVTVHKPVMALPPSKPKDSTANMELHPKLPPRKPPMVLTEPPPLLALVLLLMANLTAMERNLRHQPRVTDKLVHMRLMVRTVRLLTDLPKPTPTPVPMEVPLTNSSMASCKTADVEASSLPLTNLIF